MPKLTEKAKLQKDTEELVNLVLPLPREVKSFFDRCVKPSIGRGYEFAEYITTRKGRLLQRVFCFQIEPNKVPKATVRECARRYEGGALVVSNIVGGWYMHPYLSDTYHEEKTMHESGWVPEYCFKVSPSKMSLASPWLCLNEKKWLKKYPYCAYEKYDGYKRGFFNYLCSYRKERKVELLVKAGYSNFVCAINSLNISGKNFKDIFRVKQDFAEEYLRHGNVQDLHILRKHEWIDSEMKLLRFKRVLSQIRGEKEIRFTDDEYRYIVETDIRANDYNDYLKAAKGLAYPLNEKRYHFPKDFKRAHDKATKEMKVITDRKKDEEIKKISTACNSLSFEKDGYRIFPLTCANDLLKESETLNHCVRTYVDRVAEGRSLIMFVRKSAEPDKPFVTLELTRSDSKSDKPLKKQFNRISQVRARNNEAPDIATTNFVLDWKRKYHLTGWTA